MAHLHKHSQVDSCHHEHEHVHHHDRGHHHHHHHDHASQGNIAAALFLNALFVIIEVVGGVWTNSIAILSDALHDFGDCLSLGMAWYLQKKSRQERDAHYSYGYKRFSLMGSVFLSGILLVSSIWMLVEAVDRLAHPVAVHAQGMLWLAVLGILINGAAALRVKKGTSLNERAVYLHIMEDALGWIAVLIVSIVMIFIELPILDPILSIAISLWVLWHVYGNLRDTFRVLLQATPSDVELDELKKEILKIEGVDSLHDLHLWSLDGESHVMTVHLVTCRADGPALKAEVIRLASEYHIVHSTIEVEQPNDICYSNCDDPACRH